MSLPQFSLLAILWYSCLGLHWETVRVVISAANMQSHYTVGLPFVEVLLASMDLCDQGIDE
eukprot:2093749-Amphidinium_carterae.1